MSETRATSTERAPAPANVERELAGVALAPSVMFGTKLVIVGRKVA